MLAVLAMVGVGVLTAIGLGLQAVAFRATRMPRASVERRLTQSDALAFMLAGQATVKLKEAKAA